MATQSSGRSPGRVIPALVLWLAGVTSWVAVPASAQGPHPPDGAMPGLVVWQGNRRVDPNRPAVRLVSPAAAAVSPAQEASLLPPVRTFEPTQSTLPPIPSPAPPPAPTVVPAVHPQKPARAVPEVANDETGMQEIQRLIRTTRELTEECQFAIKTCRATVEKARQMEPEPAAIRLTPVVPPAETAPHKEAVESTTRPAPERPAPEGIGWAQVALLAGAVLACPLMVVLLAALFVRRTELQLRVEVLNSGPMIARLEPGWPTTPPARSAPSASVSQLDQALGDMAAPPSAPQEPASTGEQFDLGPTYEEERLAKEEALRQQEQALLQQVFEENCRLHEELAALEPEAEGGDEGQETDGPQYAE